MKSKAGAKAAPKEPAAKAAPKAAAKPTKKKAAAAGGGKKAKGKAAAKEPAAKAAPKEPAPKAAAKPTKKKAAAGKQQAKAAAAEAAQDESEQSAEEEPQGSGAKVFYMVTAMVENDGQGESQRPAEASQPGPPRPTCRIASPSQLRAECTRRVRCGQRATSTLLLACRRLLQRPGPAGHRDRTLQQQGRGQQAREGAGAQAPLQGL